MAEKQQDEHKMAATGRETTPDSYGRVPVACVVQIASFWEDENRYTCGVPADVEVFATSGEWEPWCEPHAHSVPAYRIRERQAPDA